MIADPHAEFAYGVSIVKPCGIHLIGTPVELDTDDTLEDAFLVIEAVRPITAASSGTLRLGLASDDAMQVATDGSARFHVQSKVYDINSTPIPRGSLAVLPMPVRSLHCTYRRFLGLLMTVTGAPINGGMINAFLTKDRKAWQLNPARN